MPYDSNRLDRYQSCVFRQRLSMLLAVPKCGVWQGSGAKLTGNHLLILMPSDDQASIMIGELQWLAVLYCITMGNSFADEAILGSHVIMSYLLCCNRPMRYIEFQQSLFWLTYCWFLYCYIQETLVTGLTVINAKRAWFITKVGMVAKISHTLCM